MQPICSESSIQGIGRVPLSFLLRFPLSYMIRVIFQMCCIMHATTLIEACVMDVMCTYNKSSVMFQGSEGVPLS